MRHVPGRVDPRLMPLAVLNVEQIETLAGRDGRIPVLEDDAAFKDQLNAARPDRYALNVLRCPLADPKIELTILGTRAARICDGIELLRVLDKLRFTLHRREILLVV